MRVALVALVVTSLAFAAALVLARGRDNEAPPVPSPQAVAKPTYGQLARIVDRIDGDRESLETHGVLLESAGVGSGCVFVSLANPTAPNIAYLRRRYPNVCVEPRPLGPIVACVPGRGEARRGSVSVPDVGDLGLIEASRRVLAADLTFTTSCIGRERNIEWVPSNSADRLVRVVGQCPRPGQRVRPGTEVALSAKAVLPGAFDYLTGALVGCVDGRYPES